MTALVAALLGMAACSSDEGKQAGPMSTATTVGPATSGGVPSTAATSAVATSTVTSSTLGESPSTTSTAATTATTDAESSTIATTTSPAATPTTLPDARTRAGDALATSLPTAEALGIPPDWSVRDLQAGPDEASIPPSELDPFRNVVTCPAGFTAFAEGGPWAERKYNGVEPSPEGVLIIRVQLVREDEAAWERRREVVGECEAVSVDAFVDRATATVTIDPSLPRIPVERLAVFSSATAEAPFPSQVVFVAANNDGVTAAVTYFGLNDADEFDTAALDLLARALSAASG